MKYRTFAETTLEGGESHKKHNKPCQDRSKHYSEDGMYIAVIADGHGSDNCFRSEYGAAFAVDAAIEGIKAFITNLRGKELPTEYNFARQVKELAGSIVDNWIYRVSEHYRKYPILEEDKEYDDPKDGKLFFPGLKKFSVDNAYKSRYLEETQNNREGKDNSGGGGFLEEAERPISRHAYGATLIAAALTDDYWFGIQTGDGKFTALYPDGSFDQPIPWDDKCYLNVTTSICDDDAAERARVFVKKRAGGAACGDVTGVKEVKCDKPHPAAIFVNSDGVDDSFPIDENMDHMVKKFYYPVLRMFTENETAQGKGWDASVKELAEFLPGLSKRGSGDDISVSAIMDMDAIQSAPFQSALQKAKIEADARRAREQAEREEAARKAAEAAEAARKAAEAAEKEAAEKETAEKEAKEAAARENTAKQAGAIRQVAGVGTPKKPKANDPEVQKDMKELKALNEEEAELKRRFDEIAKKRNEMESELKLKYTVEVVVRKQNADSEGETDIPASDAYKNPQNGRQGGTVDLKA
jgi:hypothetical protein